MSKFWVGNNCLEKVTRRKRKNEHFFKPDILEFISIFSKHRNKLSRTWRHFPDFYESDPNFDDDFTFEPPQ